MSDLEDSFLQEIARQPHDWLPRLIFADWLEEQGDPRGELLRLSHQLTRLDCENRPHQEARQRTLSAAGVVWPSPALPNSLDMKLVLIPPGQFRMGSPPEEKDRSDDERQVNVTLTQGFWLGQYTVTQAEYAAVTGEKPSYFNQAELKSDSSRHPVEQVNFEQALRFCKKLNAQERRAGRLPSSWAYALPGEAEWEYACRAGTTTATSFGDKLDSTQANFNGDQPYNGPAQGGYKAHTTAGGSYRPNAWDVYDMHGNVWEWCRDRYAAQLPGGTDPGCLDQAKQPVVRGGCWISNGGACRSACRSWFTQEGSSSVLGFRVAVIQTR